MAKIFFSDFDKDKINAGGWGCEEGRLCMELTHPLYDNKSIDAVDESLDKNKFRYVGEIIITTKRFMDIMKPNQITPNQITPNHLKQQSITT